MRKVGCIRKGNNKTLLQRSVVIDTTSQGGQAFIFKMVKYERVYVSNTRERWTSEDMFWAYRLGLRRGRR